MSEELKCPCCGGPMQKYDDPYASTFVACNSGNDECMFVCDINNFQRITAAMELARVCVDADAAMRANDNDDEMPAIYERFSDAEQRVLEVFK